MSTRGGQDTTPVVCGHIPDTNVCVCAPSGQPVSRPDAQYIQVQHMYVPADPHPHYGHTGRAGTLQEDESLLVSQVSAETAHIQLNIHPCERHIPTSGTLSDCHLPS